MNQTMLDIKDFIPPNTVAGRMDFSNRDRIDKLTAEEKVELEDCLIEMLTKSIKTDQLITDTLAYLKSEKAVTEMMKAVGRCEYEIGRLFVLSSIFEINHDVKLIEPAILSFQKIENEKPTVSFFRNAQKISYYHTNLIEAIYQLAKFNQPETTKIVEGFIHHKEYLVSYNAKRSLELLAG